MDSESTIAVGDIRSPVLARGPVDAREAVVFVHGIFGSKEDWADLMGRLPQEVRAVAPDMPGYGAASRPSDFDYTVEGYSRHLAACLDQLGVDQADLVLHDFGGLWGLAFATAHPDRVRSFTLINAGIVDDDYRWHKWARVWQTPVRSASWPSCPPTDSWSRRGSTPATPSRYPTSSSTASTRIWTAARREQS